MQKYYIYEHWRTDLNECFYVGLSGYRKKERISGYRTKYERAFLNSKYKRTDLWKEVYLKEFHEVKIIAEELTKEEGEKIEIELIKKYGRKLYDQNGTLVNLSTGGLSNEGRKRRNCPILQLTIDTEEIIKKWDQPRDIENNTGFLKTNIVKCCRNKQLTAYGYKWKYLNVDYKNTYATAARKKSNKCCVGIEIYDIDNNFIEKIRSIREISEKYNIKKWDITKCLKNEYKHEKYIFKYSSW